MLESSHMKHAYSLDQLSLVAQQVINDAFSDHQTRALLGAAVVGLEGDLGAGKTTLVKEIASRFGVTDTVTSPTFVIAKWYDMEDAGHHFKKLVHIDAYRIEDEIELEAIHFDTLCQEEHALVIVEWPDRIPHAMKKAKAIRFVLTHEGEERQIDGPYQYED